jgi:hypothetical protein
MLQMRSIIARLCLLLVISSCQQEEKTQCIKVKQQYSVDLPAFMSRGSDLNENASLQFQNVQKELYIIVIEDLKVDLGKSLIENQLTADYSDDLKGYSKLIWGNFIQSMEVDEQSEQRDTIINGLPSRLLDIQGTNDGVKAFFKFALIEGKSNYYQLLVWTLPEKKQEFSSKMTRMIQSFREL